MTYVASQFTYRLVLTVTAVVLLGTLGHAQAQPSHAQRIAARITELHTKLHITPTQEALWTPVTQVMQQRPTDGRSDPGPGRQGHDHDGGRRPQAV